MRASAHLGMSGRGSRHVRTSVSAATRERPHEGGDEGNEGNEDKQFQDADVEHKQTLGDLTGPR